MGLTSEHAAGLSEADFKDEEVIDNLAKRFIPVAVDQHVHRRLKDAEGALFAKVLKQAGRGLGAARRVSTFSLLVGNSWPLATLPMPSV